ncbi:hypothetical protein SAMN04515617_10521 [Collimonas sp. OK242]|jgi:hypothetical protein|uniref:hypothetical protein n=1 Tax=Collimonas sp. OK242 TaxID=1798195 RepID=UPI00089C44AC|nr:hypothetical protein [Collimonas sp. OK242]SDX58609.1 hypothetical protein SAMN04515617_10521 [Collimonas sp. OK242]
MSNLHSTPEPHNADVMLAKALTRLYRPAETLSSLRQFKPDETRYAAHHAVYDLAADAVAAGGRLDQVQRTGSRYLLMVKGKPSATIEIETDPHGTTAGEFKLINHGPFVQGTEKAIILAESEADDEHYDFSLLRLAPLKLLILWLKSVDASQAARFYVIEPAPTAFRTDIPYTEDALFALMRPLAQALFIRHPGAGQGPSGLVG